MNLRNRAITALESLYKSGNRVDRCNVIRTLGGIKAAESIPLLIDALQDDDIDVRINAVKALGELGVVKAIPMIADLVSLNEHPDIEKNALTALAQIGDMGHMILSTRLKDGSERERRQAAQAFGHATTTDSLPKLSQGLLDSEATVREATLRALAQRQAAQYMKAILVYLRDPDPEVKAAAMSALTELGETSGNIVHPDQLNDKLLPLLSDTDPDVRIAALKFIANYHQAGQFSKPVQQALLATVTDPVSGVAEAACDTAAKLQHVATIPDLLLNLNKIDLNPSVRRQAALALGKMPDCSAETLQALIAAIRAPQQPVRLGALQALSQLYIAHKVKDETVLGILLAASHRELLEEQLSGHQSDDAPTESAKPKTQPLPQDVQLLAIGMLPELMNEGAIETLLELLQHEEEPVQKEAAAAIEELTKSTTNTGDISPLFEPLMNTLESGRSETQAHAARSLGHLGHPDALNLLQKNVQSGEDAVRVAALEGINQLLQQSINSQHMESEAVNYTDLFDVIGQSLLDDEARVRLHAAEALTNARVHQQNRFDQPQLIEQLIMSALQDNGEQTRQMGELLQSFDTEQSIAQLLDALDTAEKSDERRSIIEMIETLLQDSSE